MVSRGNSPAAANRFRADILDALRFIGDYPLGSKVMKGTTRGKTLVRFPYTIVYVVLCDRVRVLAIADERRDPEYYAGRYV